jgi:predicted phosphodiesterase
MAGGHTYLQMVRQHDGMLIVNPGSVGLPFREHPEQCAPKLLPHAEYATIEANDGTVGVQLRRVAVDRRAMAAAVAATDNPINHYLLEQYAR